MTKYTNLFSPLKVGKHTYKNRIEAAPAMFAFTHYMDCAFMFKPNTPERSFRMLEAKAKGGAASVILGELSPDNSISKRFPFEPDVNFKEYSGEIFDIIAKTGKMIHKYDAIALCELVGVGESKPYLGDGIHPKGPSAKVMADGTEVEELTKEEIKEVIGQYVQACKWFKEAGWDGVMIHAGHGWLPAQFLSSNINKRTDEYGGTLENRTRYSIELLSSIRKELGEDFIIEVRVSGSEHIPGGIELNETIEYCKLIEKYIDLIHVSSGHYWKPGRSWEFTTAYAPHGANVDNAAKIKENVSIPVAVVGGINDPAMAEQIIAEGKVDMVSLGRQMFADPDFPNKAKEGKEANIRKCLRCAKCYPGPTGEHPTERPLAILPSLGSCTVNPYMVWNASHHPVLPEEMPVPTGSRSVVIVGGGAGGMQAAITAYDRGHKVILIEKENQLGGILNFTDHTDHKVDIRNFKNLLAYEVGQRNIEVRLNTVATNAYIQELNPDYVIIAIGSDDLVPRIEGIENALSAMDVYQADFTNLGKSTIILGGGLVGAEAACDYQEKGIQTTIIEKQECLMPESYGIYRTAVHDCIDELGVKYYVNSTVVKVEKDSVVFEKDGELVTICADSVVNALGRRSKSALVNELTENLTVPYKVIGDALKARQIGEAVDEGYMAAMEII